MTKKIWIDGDACPVKEEVIQVATKRAWTVKLVTTRDHHSAKNYGTQVERLEVAAGPDAVDFYIVGKAQAGDVVVTQDYGLASLLVAKNVRVVHHSSFVYTPLNIDQLLMQRYASAQARKAGKRTKGPKAFSAQDRQKFAHFFDAFLAEQ